jgi:hypothetical protein
MATTPLRHWLIALGGGLVGLAAWLVVIYAVAAGDCPPTC